MTSASASAGTGSRRATDGPLLAVRGVPLQYKTREHLVTATWRVDFEVLAADRFVLLGPSGCGKSTLLKAVGGYMQPVEGEIRLKGRRIDRPGPDRMMVFQGSSWSNSWNTIIRSGPGRSMTRPFNRIVPSTGFMKPATPFNRVDLPQPEGPSRTKRSAG